MIPFLKKRNNRFKNIDFMTLVPAKNVKHEINDETGQIVLLLPRFQSGPLGKFLQPRLSENKKIIRVPLEERGKWLWENIDGVSRIGEMVPGFSAKFPGDKEQVAMRLGAFLYRMEENGFIIFAQ